MSQVNQRLTIEQVLKQAFSYWSRTLLYQILMTLLYFSVLFLAFYFGSAEFGLLGQYENALLELNKGAAPYIAALKKIAASPDFGKLQLLLTITTVFLYPLNMGLLKMYRKLDLDLKPDAEDLFAGYIGSNFFTYTSFYLFWVMVYNLLMPTIFLAAGWVFATLFCGPLMFFMGKRIFEGINLSYKALRLFPVEIFVCVLVAVIIRYLGLLTFVGGLFTFPIWTAIIYALYRNIFSEGDK